MVAVTGSEAVSELSGRLLWTDEGDVTTGAGNSSICSIGERKVARVEGRARSLLSGREGGCDGRGKGREGEAVSLASIVLAIKTRLVILTWGWRKKDRIISERDCILCLSSTSIGVSYSLSSVW